MREGTKPVVTLFESISVNGMIARPNDDAGFFTDINWTAFVDLAISAGAMVWGRKTHEMYRRQAVASMPGVHGFVLTSNGRFKVEEGWNVAASPEEAAALAAKAGAKELVVAGGATVNTSFARSGLVDRIVLNVESLLIGEGIPLFSPAKFDMHLQFRESRKLTPTVIQLHYDVRRA